MATLADWFKSQTKDYGQLKDAYPNAKKFGSALKNSISQHVPTQQDYQSPDKMIDYGMSVAPMGLTVKAPGLNTGLSNNLADYVGSHTAPMKGDSAAPLHDLAAIYPEDIYSNKAAQYYGDYGGSHPMDRESISAMHSAKGKPDSLVTMFRAVPSEPTIQKQISLLEKQKAYIQKNGKVPRTANTSLDRSDYYDEISNQLDNLYAMPEQSSQQKPSINNGDWVTLSRTYAKEHGQSHLNNNYKILSKKVPARKLFTNADSIHEFGYDESGKANLGLLGGLAGAGTLGAYLYGNRGER